MDEVFANKKVNFDKLVKFGFSKIGDKYIFKQPMIDNEFMFVMEISLSSEYKINVFEISTNEVYTLHLAKSAQGNFVGKVKAEYYNIISQIAQSCFDNDIFKYEQTKAVIDLIKNKYSDEMEYLWAKFPNNAIARHPKTKKWYAAILTVKKNKFGFDNNEMVEVIDLHVPKEDVPNLLKMPNIYPGYHMNKKSWISIILDGSTRIEDIAKYLDVSYKLAAL